MRVIDALARIARHHREFVRPPFEWKAIEGSPFVQFRSLVEHLFASYPVPKFMAAAWLSGNERSAAWQQRLFLHLGAGRSIRQFDTKIRLTKSMVGHFMKAPDDLTVEGALRWGQVRGLGGNNCLARAVVQTRLAVATTDEPFWESVIRFLVSNAKISQAEVREIVDFIHQQRFEAADTVVGRGAGSRPLQPDFTIRGRSLMSLRRHMTHWREETLPQCTGTGIRKPATWPRTGIGAFRYAEQNRCWTIDELLTDWELRVEGSILQHCAARYIGACARRQTSIWSMKLDDGVRRRRILTIEVDPATRTIWQAKGKRNRDPDTIAVRVLNRWAEKEGLTCRMCCD
jgi:hypothetical protein